MRKFIFSSLTTIGILAITASAFPQREYGFDNTKSSGQPYLTPEESVARMKVPDGWEVKLFAAEPDVINPISFTIDEKGRVWVVECYEYPKRTPPGKMPRDRIIILEDTKGTGKADKRTVWAEGKDFPTRFDLATGIEVGHGGVFLGAAPYLWFLQDTKGTGHADKFEILLKGFGSQDTHETLNTLNWGPDGRLYGLHGVFTNSEVTSEPDASARGKSEPDASARGKSERETQANANAVKINGGVWRYDVRTKKFEVFAEGTSNPWGMDWDSNGNCFLCCCVIPHLFHIVPGGIYKRQAGASFNPYCYGYLNEICDHTFHKESGWAHAGLLCLDNPNVPEEFRTSVIFGSIHGCSIKRNILERKGSTFVAHKAPDFLVSGDKNFRPINMRWGPDGSIYVIDWHDQNNCHQSHPDSWDMTHGRIYRIQRKGTKNTLPGDLSRKSIEDLFSLLANNNPWWYRTALRLLGERADELKEPEKWGLMSSQISEIEKRKQTDPDSFIRYSWGLSAIQPKRDSSHWDHLSEEQLQKMAIDVRKERTFARRMLVRNLAGYDRASRNIVKYLEIHAREESASEVRLELASAAGRLGNDSDTMALLHALLSHKEDATDPAIPLMLWFAYEKQVAAKPQAALAWLKDNAAGNPLVTDHIISRVMRRLVATGKADDLAGCVDFLDGVADGAVRKQALLGLTEALKGRQVNPPAAWAKLAIELRNDQDRDIKRLTEQLAVNFRDPKAGARAVATLNDKSKPKEDRLIALETIRLDKSGGPLPAVIDVLFDEKDIDLRVAAATTLATFDGEQIPDTYLGRWKEFPPAVKTELLNGLKSRRSWAHILFNYVELGAIPASDINNNTIMALRKFKDAKLNERIAKLWGTVRESPKELEELIAKMRGFMHEGHGDFERGRKVFEKNCMQCHKFEGKGHEVGPQLDGAERSMDYLLINILDPNRVVGAPYYMRTVLLKNGKVLTGLAAGEDDQTLSLKRENAGLEIIQKKDIEEAKTEAKSLMPEGLDKNITPPEFRDLIRYLMANPYLTEVQVSDLRIDDNAFEKALAPEQGDPLKAESFKWTAPEVGPSGQIRLDFGKPYGKEPVQYVYAEVTAPAEMKTRLLLGTKGKCRVWLNGQLLTTVQCDDRSTPDQHSIEVTLKPGANRLLFKVAANTGAAYFYARLLDPDRKLTNTALK